MWNWLFKKVISMREKVAIDLGDNDPEKPFLDHLEDLRDHVHTHGFDGVQVSTHLTFCVPRLLIGS